MKCNIISGANHHFKYNGCAASSVREASPTHIDVFFSLMKGDVPQIINKRILKESLHKYTLQKGDFVLFKGLIHEILGYARDDILRLLVGEGLSTLVPCEDVIPFKLGEENYKAFREGQFAIKKAFRKAALAFENGDALHYARVREERINPDNPEDWVPSVGDRVRVIDQSAGWGRVDRGDLATIEEIVDTINPYRLRMDSPEVQVLWVCTKRCMELVAEGVEPLKPLPVEEKPAPLFKKAQKVRLVNHEDYGKDNIMNPLDKEGSVIKVESSHRFPIWVDWGEGIQNSYKETDLEAL